MYTTAEIIEWQKKYEKNKKKTGLRNGHCDTREWVVGLRYKSIFFGKIWIFRKYVTDGFRIIIIIIFLYVPEGFFSTARRR